MKAVQVILGLGSNLGDRTATLRSARASLSQQHRLLGVSSLYETEPIGLREQPAFLNQVVAVETSLSPQVLLEACLGIERAHGRERGLPNGPRTLDIDLLFYGQEAVRTETLRVPHPRWRERAFVVEPLRELLSAEPLLSALQWDGLRAELVEHHGSGEIVRFGDALS